MSNGLKATLMDLNGLITITCNLISLKSNLSILMILDQVFKQGYKIQVWTMPTSFLRKQVL